MICTVTMNPALDYIVSLSELKRGEINRAARSRLRAGGKGINVSAVLKSFGISSAATGFVAGRTGELLCDMLREAGIFADFVRTGGMTRINVKIRAGEETDINGEGPAVTEEAFSALLAKAERLPAGSLLVLAGSLPASLPAGAVGRLFAAAEGARVAVDGSGEVLREALPLRPWLVKPNRDELAQLYGVRARTREEALPLARRLCSDGARNALVSLGEEGAVLACESGGEYAMPAFPGRAADTVGAGDSLLAGFIAAYEGGQSAEQALAQGVAAGCATAFRIGLAPAEEAFALLRSRENGTEN